MNSTAEHPAHTDPSHTLLRYYEAIGQVSQIMLAAAMRADWPSLENAHACCTRLIHQVRATGLTPDALDPAGRRRRLQILRQILADDARVRDLTNPSYARIDSMLVGEQLASYERGR
jgi:flagellar protein FliT